MKRKAILFFMLLPAIMFLSAEWAPASGADTDKGNWIQGVLFNLEKMRDDAAARIRTNEETIRKSNNLIRRARELHKPDVEAIARRALAKATEAKKKNEWQLQKARAGIPRVRNLLAKTRGQEAKIQAVVSHISGRAFCYKKDTDEWIDLNSDSGVYLEPGDVIRTASGQVELRMLEGEGTITVGPFTRFKVRKPSLGSELIDLYEGTIMPQIKKLSKSLDDKYRFAVITPTAICGIRGTQFLVNVDSEKATELVVLDGTVEVRSLSGERTVLIKAGHMIRVRKGEDLPKPSPVDLNRITRWWETEQEKGSMN